ncbi:hypothetical protein FRX31_031857 [Thalictrum thalictroides]|uniref:Uncharacterized protein n=1 Tax=Thalictrum thalictroides TaxID=46969 RepID=A0A7J6V1H5_THATH|nr:hypothetical protein FRX31_031857 [Thalictrum thalictroides]
MIVLLVFIAALVVIAVRATVVTWITVLVLLAFAGNRRKVLVRQGSNITADITMSVMKTVFKECSFLAIIFLVLTFIVHIQRLGHKSICQLMDVNCYIHIVHASPSGA